MDEYYVTSLAAADEGPYTLRELSQKAQAGHIHPSTQIKCPGGIVVPASMVSGIEGLSRTPSGPMPSYQGSLPYGKPVPKELNSGFHFGAFLLTWIWGLPHRAPFSILALALDVIIAGALALMAANVLPYTTLEIISILHWPMMIWFGIQGNRWAWLSEKYETPEACKAAQKQWTIAGFVFGGVMVIVGAYLFLYYARDLVSVLGMVRDIRNGSSE